MKTMRFKRQVLAVKIIAPLEPSVAFSYSSRLERSLNSSSGLIVVTPQAALLRSLILSHLTRRPKSPV
jgi:hypothetical protein